MEIRGIKIKSSLNVIHPKGIMSHNDDDKQLMENEVLKEQTVDHETPDLEPQDLEFLKREELLDYIFLNLKIISQIQENQKVRIIKLNGLDTLDIDNRLIHMYIRGRGGDDHNTTIEMIKKIINLCHKVSDEILKEELERTAPENKEINPFDAVDDNSRLFRRLVVEMENALSGLEHLKNTYTRYVSVTSAIDIMIGKMKLRISKINALLRISHLPPHLVDV